MNHINYSYLRNNLAKILDEVNSDHMPVIVTRQKGKAAVLISLEDFNAYEETAYLMKSHKNAVRLNQAIEEIAMNKVIKNNIIEE